MYFKNVETAFLLEKLRRRTSKNSRTKITYRVSKLTAV